MSYDIPPAPLPEDFAAELLGDKVSFDGELPAASTFRKTATVEARKMPGTFTVNTLEGTMTGEAGDYLAGPGAAGEYWPVKAEVFESTHQEIPAERQPALFGYLVVAGPDGRATAVVDPSSADLFDFERQGDLADVRASAAEVLADVSDMVAAQRAAQVALQVLPQAAAQAVVGAISQQMQAAQEQAQAEQIRNKLISKGGFNAPGGAPRL